MTVSACVTDGASPASEGCNSPIPTGRMLALKKGAQFIHASFFEHSYFPENRKIHAWMELRSIPSRTLQPVAQVIDIIRDCGANVVLSLHQETGVSGGGSRRYTTHFWVCTAGIYLDEVDVLTEEDRRAQDLETRSLVEANLDRLKQLRTSWQYCVPDESSSIVDPKAVGFGIGAVALLASILYYVLPIYVKTL